MNKPIPPAHDVAAALRHIEARELRTVEEDRAAFPRLGDLGAAGVYAGRFAGRSPWELHRGDELLYVLEGQTEITLLLDEGPHTTVVRAGCLFVVPSEIWHRQVASPSVTLIAITPDDSEGSHEDDPRVAGKGAADVG